MFEQIKSIIIKGGPFLTDTPLELIPNRMNLLYGRNGSGKSTIPNVSNVLVRKRKTMLILLKPSRSVILFKEYLSSMRILFLLILR